MRIAIHVMNILGKIMFVIFVVDVSSIVQLVLQAHVSFSHIWREFNDITFCLFSSTLMMMIPYFRIDCDAIWS